MQPVTNIARAARQDTPHSDRGTLHGARVLIVEDEALLALDLALTIWDEGGMVEGPLHRLGEALALTGLDIIDAAILDVDIGGQEVFAFADRLRAARVPIVFHTGRSDLALLAARYPAARILRKPCPMPQVVGALSQALTRTARSVRAAAS